MSGRLKRAAPVLVSAGLIAAIGLWYFAFRTPAIPRRTLRIGFENVPPVQMVTEGGPAGIAVETINEAARRSGITLQWVQTGTSSEQSFRRGLVDLWPLMADLPDRRKWIHITIPWLHTNHTLVLRQHVTPPDRGFTGRLAIFKLPVHSRLAREQFPEAQLVQFADTHDVIREVCTGSVGAAFLELRAALAALGEKPPECTSIALRVAPVPDATLQ